MHTALVISPHADDAAAFCGATLAKFAALGWRIVLVRVTDDARDSMNLTAEDTIRVNTKELHTAAKIMGIAEIEELGFPTDTLGDVSRVELRERFVYLFRKHQPYAVFSFDPFVLHENNLDHTITAQAVDEAFWVSTFDKHHPEHFEEGLAPFSVCERWYFGRDLPSANHVEDVTEHIETCINALCAHKTMMRNTVNQLKLQAQTWGRRVPVIDAAVDGALHPLLEQFLMARAHTVAQSAGLPEGQYAELFRLERFGDLEPLMQALGEPIDGARPAPRRATFGEEA